MPNAVYEICVDWDNNGNYTGTYDDISADVIIGPDLGLNWNRGRDKQLGSSKAGTFEFNTNNVDGKYSPEKAAGVLYGNLIPGRPVRLRATYDATPRNLWHGFTSRITPYPWHDKKNCYFYCVDGMEWLSMAKVAPAMLRQYEYYIGTKSSSYQIKGDTWQGQTFTVGNVGPSEDNYAVHVKLWMRRYGTPGDLTVSIKAVDGDGHPTGDDLTSVTVGEAYVSEDDDDWYIFTFATQPALIADTQYAIVVKALSAVGDNRYAAWFDMTSPTYGGGNLELSSDGGASWSSETTRDMNFEIWGRSQDRSVVGRTQYEIINALLDAAGWPASARVIDNTCPQLYSFWEDSPGQSALSMIQKLEEITGGVFFVDRDGSANWQSAAYRSINSGTPVVSFNDTMHGLTYNLDAQDVYNHIVVRVAPEQVAAGEGTVGEVGGTEDKTCVKPTDMSLNYESENVHRFFVDTDDVAASWQNLRARVTLLGADVTADMRIFIKEQTGRSCLVSYGNFTYDIFPSPYLTWLSVDYTPLTEEVPEEEAPAEGGWGSGELIVEVEDTVSQGKYTYGLKKTKEVHVPFPMPYEDALLLANFYLNYFKDPVPDISQNVKNDTEVNLLAILDSIISDRVTVIHANSDLNADCFINQENHRVTEGGLWHEVKWILEKCASQRAIFVWDTSVFDSGAVWAPW